MLLRCKTPFNLSLVGAKLAPMFLIGKKKEAASPAKPALDQEQVRQRRLFLMSGVPEELKKQTSIRQANTTGLSYPPIPTINHVQQVCVCYLSHSVQNDIFGLEQIHMICREQIKLC